MTDNITGYANPDGSGDSNWSYRETREEHARVMETGLHECASDCPINLPERMGRLGPQWWQDVICSIFGHDWHRSPWCECCGRLEHY